MTCMLCGRSLERGTVCAACAAICSVCAHPHALTDRCATCGHQQVKSTTHSGYDELEQPYEKIPRRPRGG